MDTDYYTSYIGLDFETYGAVSLPDHGLERYASHKSFRSLIAATSVLRPAAGSLIYQDTSYDFVLDYYTSARKKMVEAIEGKIVVAHNAGFEERVLRTMDVDTRSMRFMDSAVVARAAGAGGKLEAAAPQLLGVDKLEDGRRLIMLFSVPGKEQRENGDMHFDPNLVTLNQVDWQLFHTYCRLDARLGLRLALEAGFDNEIITVEELDYQHITMAMNQRGWPVDVERVEEMQRRYLENQERALEEFRAMYDAHDLNLNSLPQQKEWCAKRGIKANSFDEKNVAKLMARIKKRLDAADNDTKPLEHSKYVEYCDVLAMLETKKILGGSSLKKLQVILDTVGEDGRLRDQYLHIGAGQSWRTTGRSAQMQNLKRIAEPADMDTLDDPDSEWDNDQLAANIRQVFTASDPNGALIVGDFSSIESRGLAWLANEHYKLDAYRQGLDLYKVLAMQIYGLSNTSLVTKDQRQTGKVGELSCGYQAGPEAVQSFAAKMGVEMNEAEAGRLVHDWRRANPQIVILWQRLDDALHAALKDGRSIVPIGFNFQLEIVQTWTPPTLVDQHPGAHSLRVTLFDERGERFLVRIFHGCYIRGRSICYYKPSQLKGGALWSNHFTDPKTKQVKFYSIYGGKLAGILTQSFCRELFFRVLKKVHAWTENEEGLDLIGQFHDEIVLDKSPSAVSVGACMSHLETLMSDAPGVRGFPMAAEVKHDYRYTK